MIKNLLRSPDDAWRSHYTNGEFNNLDSRYNYSLFMNNIRTISFSLSTSSANVGFAPELITPVFPVLIKTTAKKRSSREVTYRTSIAIYTARCEQV